MKVLGAVLLSLCALPNMGRAAEFNIATLTCIKYQNEVVGPQAPAPTADPINTVMWLFGYSVAKSGAHVMYGGALAAFGFGLDAECQKNPAESLLTAIAVVKPDSKNPMDLSALDCATFATRHMDLVKSDPESAKTIMMWLLGFAVATSGSHIFDSAAMYSFEPALLSDCTQYPERTLYDELVAVKFGAAKK
jgi:hypothetical protein